MQGVAVFRASKSNCADVFICDPIITWTRALFPGDYVCGMTAVLILVGLGESKILKIFVIVENALSRVR